MEVHRTTPGETQSGSLMRKPYYRLRDGQPEMAGWIVFEKGTFRSSFLTFIKLFVRVDYFCRPFNLHKIGFHFLHKRIFIE